MCSKHSKSYKIVRSLGGYDKEKSDALFIWSAKQFEPTYKRAYPLLQNQLDFGLDLSRCWEAQATTAKGW